LPGTKKSLSCILISFFVRESCALHIAGEDKIMIIRMKDFMEHQN
jgi:hypothetical protein